MADKEERPNPGHPGRGFRLVTDDGAEKFLPIPVPLAQGAGQPPSEPPEAPPAAMEPEPEKQPEQEIVETREAKIARLEKEYTDLLSALYWVQSELEELQEKSEK